MQKFKKLLPLYFIILCAISCSDSESDDLGTDEFVELGIPELTTNIATNITDNSAVSGGDISDDGGAEIISKGVCWSVSSTPTIDDFITSDGTGAADFTSVIDGLEPNTEYFVRAYATNTEGVGYGNEISFTSIEPGPIAKIFNGDLILTSQQEVDEFGAVGYTQVSGNITVQDINSPSSIENLSPLSTISLIKGSLIIKENLYLHEITGFDALENIEGSLTIIANDNLESINSFANVLSIGDDLEIYGVNNGSGTIDGFGNLTTIGSNLTIQLASGVENLLFFESLQMVNGSIFIALMDSLTSLNGLEKLNTLFSLRLNANNSLLSLSGLNNISNIDEALMISGNRSLEDLKGLESLTTILNGDLNVSNNVNLKNLGGLDNLESIGGKLIISGNDLLENLQGLNSLEITGAGIDCILCIGTIEIQSNNALLNIDALENLNTAWNADIIVEYNEKLENLDGFQNLSNIFKSSGGSSIFGVTLSQNSNLNDVCGLKNLFDSNQGNYYLDGFGNGTILPEGEANSLFRMCE
ncbi:hypothetical protein SAMN05192545_1573 [Maribacter dokdonensis]|uniref:Fibronectin type-III domain-containing protein n=1 Tax=Maribacter dokdonensis TaxID=320912 RepID=A0ABY0UEA0_9FLAO|nr:hypothetical protein [Maribacter dokdonensis]SDS53616.1 hypothetical protein SAMN05192545_1573 [Maribacter dokdonensis]